MVRAAICDDDEETVLSNDRTVKECLKQCGSLGETVVYTDSANLLYDITEDGFFFDLILLDIEMPGINGIYVGKELKRANDRIIIFIVTSYPEYLDEAMRFHVFRYLSKPLDKQRFFRNMKDAVDLYNSMTVKIPIETKQGVHTLPASSIVAVEAQGRKITVHTVKGDFESIHTIKYWENLLPKNHFFQTHRSFIINFEYVTDFDHTLVHMSDNQFHAYLTKRKYSAFKEAYLLYLESTR